MCYNHQQIRRLIALFSETPKLGVSLFGALNTGCPEHKPDYILIYDNI